MKICLINNLYPPYNRGGTEKIVEILKKELEKDYNVFTLSTHPKKKTLQKHNNYYIPSKYYNLEKMPKILRLFWHIYKLIEPFSYYKVKKILEKEKPDIIISHNLQGFSFRVFSLFSKYKHVHTLHDIQLLHPSGLLIYNQENKLNSFLAKTYQKIIKNFINSSSVVISPSNWLINLHKKKNLFKNNPFQVILNPVQEETKKNYSSSGDLNKKFKLLFVGQLTEAKGINFLLNTFKELPFSEFELEIIGTSSQFENLKNKYQKYTNINFLGLKNSKEVKEKMLEANCLIVPSICYENSPTVIYEASNCNLPVLASDLGGISELTKKSGGLLFAPLDKNDLLKKIKELKINPEKYNSKKLPTPPPKEYINLLLNKLNN